MENITARPQLGSLPGPGEILIPLPLQVSRVRCVGPCNGLLVVAAVFPGGCLLSGHDIYRTLTDYTCTQFAFILLLLSEAVGIYRYPLVLARVFT